jgi:oxalate decarboxylase/phosphoglucose isomerase-like protein (cupin superfamily)
MSEVSGFVMGPDEGSVAQWKGERHGDVEFRTLISGDQAPSSSLTTGWGELGHGCVFKTHRHTPAETYYIYAGACACACACAGTITLNRDTASIDTGDCVFIPPRAWHSLHNTSQEPLRFFFVLAADSLQDVDYEFWDGGA